MLAERSKKKSKAARKSRAASALCPGLNTPVGNMRLCRHCGNFFKPRGLTMHEKKCTHGVVQAVEDLRHDSLRGKHQGASMFIIWCGLMADAGLSP